LFTVNSTLPVVDPETPRTSASVSNLRNGGAGFTIFTNDAASIDGINDGAVTAYAGTTAASNSSDTVFTTITLAVSDGTNVTQKDIVVRVRNGAGDTTGGVSDVGVYGVALNTQNDHFDSGWTSNVQLLPPSLAVAIADGSAAAVTLTPAQQGGATGTGLGFGFAQSLLTFTTQTIPGLFTIQPGKVYRARVQIETSGSNALQSPEFQLRLGPTGHSFPGNASMEAGSQTSDGNLTPAALTNNVYEVLYEAPSNARLAGQLHTTNTVQLFYDAIVFGSAVFGVNGPSSGNLTFSNTVIDAFDSPAVGSNGAVALYDTNADFNTPAPASINTTADSNPANNAGWKFKVQNANFGAPFPTTLASLLIATTNAAQTTATFGLTPQGGTSDTLTIFTSTAGQHLTTWSIGEPEAVANNDGTVVPISLLTELSDDVYYRFSTVLRSSNSNPLLQPGFRMYVGHPFGAWQGSFEILTGNAAPGHPTPGPIVSENTIYSAWVRGAPALPTNGTNDENNYALLFQDQDFSATAGGVTVIDTVVLELFPASFF
jgi:hypothetical protein